MKHLFLLILLTLVVVACSPSTPKEVPRKPVTTETEEERQTIMRVLGRELNIGDVEQTICLNITLPIEARTQNIQVNEFMDRQDRIKLVDIEVSPPFPDSLYLDCLLQSRNVFQDTPVVLRGDYVRALDMDERHSEPIQRLTFVLADSVRNQDHTLEPIDVLEGLDKIPDSMLVTADLEILLMPLGTDPTTIDPETASTTPERYSRAFLATAVRITFDKSEMDTHSSDSEPVDEDSHDEEDEVNTSAEETES